MVQVARAPLAVLPNVGMSQSSVMLAALLAGFVVYLAIKQRLGVYWSILIGGGSAASSTATSSTSSGSIPSTQGSILGLGGTASTSTSASGGTGTATSTGIAGLPNTSLSTFFGLGS